VTFQLPVFRDNCGVPTVACTPASGSLFPVGDTTVICTASDNAGNRTACGFIVTVTPVASPVLHIVRQGNSFEISWAAATCGNFQLEGTTNLNQLAVWTAVTQAPTLSANTYRVIVPNSDPNRFFRLVGH